MNDVKSRIEDVEVAHIRAMRVAVAYDVLAQLKLKNYISRSGIYCKLRDWEAGKELHSKAKEGGGTIELQHMVTKLGKCDVCAIGAAMLSYAKLFDDTQVTTDYDFRTTALRIDAYGEGLAGTDSLLPEKLGKEFAGVIEMVFEGWERPHDEDLLVESSFDELPQKAGETGSEERMKWIMRNVIANGGVFKHKTVTGQVEV